MPTAFIDNVVVKHRLSADALADALARVETARADTNDRTAQFLKGIKADDPFLLHRHGKLLIEGHDARLVSSIAANKKMKPRLRQSLERCLAVPKLLDFSKPLPEPVPVYAKKKKSGGVRMIHKPGLLHRTAQDMVDRIMSAYYAPRPFQFTHLGLHKAIRQVKEAVNEGKVHVARLDIKEFYPSFVVEKLVTELPLPKEVVEHVVVGRHFEVVMDQESMKGSHAMPSLPHSHAYLMQQARRGLPQGSACSPIVGAFCVSRLNWTSMPDVLLINYVDDFLLLSSSPVLLDMAVGKLTDAVTDLPGGQFELQLKAKRTTAKGFDFLGHHLQVVDGKLRTKPTNLITHDLGEQLDKIETKLTTKVLGLGNWKNFDKDAAIKCLAQMAAKIDGWLSAFSECDNPAREVEFWQLYIVDWCKTLGLAHQQVLDAIEPHMDYRWDGYAIRTSVQNGASWFGDDAAAA